MTILIPGVDGASFCVVEHRAENVSRFRIKLVCFSLLIVGLSGTCNAHPGSHVDAWARIDTHLDVRVTLFLDNVLAWQEIHRQPGDSLVPAAVARTAVERFDEILLTMLMIYDEDGHRLPARIDDRPVWEPAAAGLDLAADAGLRLSWTLRYPWQPQQRSFSVQHSFVEHRAEPAAETSSLPGNSPIPAELRLRVRDAHSGRRVDAVIGYHLPHTILLPVGETVSKNQQNHTPTSARFVLLPRVLIHEFATPLVLTSAAIDFPGQESSADRQHPTMDSVRTRELAADWVRNHCVVSIDGRAVAAQSIFVGFLTAENEQIEGSDSVPLIGTRLGIRTTHSIDGSPLHVEVSWDKAPRNVSQIQVHTTDGANSTSQVVECSNDVPNSASMGYKWNLPNRAALAGDDMDQKPFGHSRSAEVTTSGPHGSDEHLWRQPRAGGIVRWLPWAVLTIAIAGIIAGIRWRWRTSVTTATIVLAATGLLALSLTPRPTEPNAEFAGKLIDRMLQKVYRVVLVRDEQSAVEQLSEVLTDDMVENVFRQIAGSAENTPFVLISDVQVVSCATASFVPNELAGFNCEWHVDGEILHWGHRHQRKMLLTGTICVESHDRSCRISDISLEHVKYSVDPGRS
ncbi:MAG: hypothetical protein ABGZ35_11420 [Planctomycetaceae bacterium]